MRRGVVTGLGAVTPIGADAPSAWRAAVAGESGIDFIRSFDASEFPVRIAAEVNDFDPSQVASSKDARRLDRNVLLSLGAAREAVADARVDGAYSPDRVGILFGTAIGGFIKLMEEHDVLRERGPDRVAPTFLPNVLVDTASGQLAISLGFRRPNYAPVSACATGATAIREAGGVVKAGGAGADQARRRRRPACGSRRGLHPSADPGRLLRQARTRGRGGAPAAGVPPVRRDSRRLRDGGGRVRARARGARGRRAPRRDDLRRDSRLRDVE